MTRSTMTLADAQRIAASFLDARRARHGDLRMDATNGGSDDGTDQTGGTDDTKSDDKPGETPEEKAARLETELATWKTNSRKHEDRAKANKDAADELARIKAATATDADKLATAEKDRDDARRELSQYRVAASTGLPADLAVLLTGDEDAMTEQAKKILALKGEAQKPKPKPDPTQGGSGGDNKVSAAEEGRAEAQRRAAARNGGKKS